MKIFLISLGCDKNLCDSEAMLGLISKAGYQITDDESLADAIIVNSCCFIGDAKQESIDAIIEAGKYKETGNCKALIVTGCLSQRYKEEFASELPEVDAMLGTTSFDKIVTLLDELLKDDKCTDYFESIDKPVRGNYPRLLSTGGHYAYLKIAEGCNKRCSYCVIPSVRGSYRSVPLEDLINEAKTLASEGVQELILVAQETTLYGKDLYGKKSLHILLDELSKIDGIKWIRVLYCYPEEIYDELIECIKSNEKVVKYLDLPIQSASDNVLKRMGRLTSKKDLENLVKKLREEIPEISLRTTLISGFPGESEEDHNETVDFVRKMKFDRLGVFEYSREEGTRAAEMEDQVPDEIKTNRKDEIMSLQQIISEEKQNELVGKTLEVFVEGKAVDEDIFVARSYKDAPDIDGFVFVKSDAELISGDFANVKITKASTYDLIGEVVNESTK